MPPFSLSFLRPVSRAQLLTKTTTSVGTKEPAREMANERLGAKTTENGRLCNDAHTALMHKALKAYEAEKSP